MELNIELLTPKVLELQGVAEKYKGLVITGIEDRAGYQIVDEARKDLKKRRVEIQKFAKEIRDEAIQFQKKVIEKEREVIAIIEPLEIELGNKQKTIDDEKLKIKMMELLPSRKEKLKEIGVEGVDDLIVLMNEVKFSEYYSFKKSEYLEKKEAELRAKEAEIARQQEIEEARQQAKKDAEDKAKRDAEIAKLDAERKLLEVKEKAKREKQDLIDKQKREKQEKIDAENEAKRVEKLEAEKLAKRKAYQTFLLDNGYLEGEEFNLVKTNTKIILYKKVSEFIY